MTMPQSSTTPRSRSSRPSSIRRCGSGRCCRRRAGSSRSLLFGLSCFHYYTAGFGLLQETTASRHPHLLRARPDLPGVLLEPEGQRARRRSASLLAPLGIGIVDWALRHRAPSSPASTCRTSSTTCSSASAIPDPIDWIMGTVMIVVLLEATRRSVGWPLPIIAVVLMVYALYGPRCRAFSRIPATPGKAWSITSISPARASSASRSASSRPTCSTTCCSACWRRASGSAASSSISRPR